MFVEELKIINYRNYKKLNLEFNKDLNIIFGNNGQGKTNIMESIYLSAFGRSHRTAKDIELVNRDENTFYIKVVYIKNGRRESIEISYDKSGKKRVKINEIPSTKISSIIGKLNVVMFSPEDIMVLKEGPSERRRLIDISISQQKPTYFFDLQQYNKILAQRNALLKNIRLDRKLMDTLDIWDKNLACIGSRIIFERNSFIRKLNGYILKNHKKLTNDTEELNIVYSSAVKNCNYDDRENIEKEFLNEIDRIKKREIEYCSTMIGPQRDEYKFILNNESLKQFGSQGQQRTAVLSLKLSEIEMVKQASGEYPVLLMDDVMSELDSKRREYLFKNIEEIQTFITCTDKNMVDYDYKENKRFFEVNKGEVKVN